MVANEPFSYAEIQPRDIADQYLSCLGFVLLGYAVLGKGFAYIGIAPLYIGEMCAVSGLFVFLLSGCFIHAMVLGTGALLVIMMMWVMICTIPYIELYEFDAIRDSVVVMYGVFALYMIAIVISHPGRVDRIIERYRKFVPLLVMCLPFTMILTRYADEHLPHMPQSNVPIIWIKPGDAGVHIAGAALAVLLGMVRPSLLLLATGAVAFAMLATDSRAAMLSVIVAVSLAALLIGKLQKLVLIIAVGVASVMVLYFVETQVVEREHSASNRRQLSVVQLLENVTSIFVKTEAKSDVQGTKEWRLQWWTKIVDDTIRGPNFWTGRGFGINLAEADGFLGTENEGLRSPHNVHMTILGRAGVPGLVLWGLLLLTWFSVVIGASFKARAFGEYQWQKLFVFIACYGSAFIVNASFDVALEGPMQGIWFWSLFGFGIGASMMFRMGASCQFEPPGGEPEYDDHEQSAPA